MDWALLTIAEIVSRPEYQFADVLQREVLLVSALLLPMTLAFGAAFPFAWRCRARGRDETVTRTTSASIYAVNTIGAILGSLLSGFVLVPASRPARHHSPRRRHSARSWRSRFSSGRRVAARAPKPRRVGRAVGFALAGAVAVAIVALPQWDRALLSSGAYKYAPAMRGPSLADGADRRRVVVVSRGLDRHGGGPPSGRHHLAGHRRQGRRVERRRHADAAPARACAAAAASESAARRDPRSRQRRDAGFRAHASARPKSTVLEISPGVVEASRFFEAENNRALADPRTRLIVGDGRTHLMLGRQSYDVIVSEPSNPWMAGIASLFTREFFEGARDRLTPGGVLCQWAHTYDISSSDLKSIVATFLSVFPNGTLWLVGDADVLLVGSTEPLDAPHRRHRRRDAASRRGRRSGQRRRDRPVLGDHRCSWRRATR